MVRALRRWLEANELLAIVAGVVGALLLLSMLLVFGGFTAFDFQRLARSGNYASAPMIAASIFLDIFNVFVLLLSIFGGGGGGRR